MIYVAIFFSFVFGILVLDENYIFFIILSIIFLFYILLRFKKKIFFISIIAFSFGIGIKSLTSFIPEPEAISCPFAITKAKDNYYIVDNYIHKYYVYEKNTSMSDGDIVFINGIVDDYDFITLESGFDFNNYLSSIGAKKQIIVKNCRLIYNNPFSKELTKDRLLSYYDKDTRNYLSSLFYGEAPTSYLQNDYKNINVIFLISCSGYFVSILISTIYSNVSRFTSDGKASLITCLILLPFQVFNIFKFSIFRVCTLYEAKSINKYILKNKFTYLGLIVAFALICLFLNPYLVKQMSFILGFSLTFLNYFLGTYLRSFKKKYQGFVRKLCLFGFLIPMAIFTNNRFNVLSFAFQIILLPVFDLCFITSFVSYNLGYIFYLRYLVLGLNNLLDFFSKLSINIYYSDINVISLIIIYIFIIFAFYLVEKRVPKINKIVIFTFLTNMCFFAIPFDSIFTSSVSFINVGQGDSILIRDKFTNVLIDTGGNIYNDIATNNLIPFFIKNKVYSIDAVFISHSDYDHCGALKSLSDNFKIKNIIENHNFYQYKVGNMTFENLNYLETTTDIGSNEQSQVLYLEFHGDKYLFMGDAPIAIERKILNEYPKLDCDYLKVGHHGSSSSSFKSFIEKISPKESIISVGKKNSYGLPDESVLKILNKYSEKVRRTDIEGTIKYSYF